MAVSDLLPVFDAPDAGRVWLVAAHGGAGCTTLYRSSPGLYADAGRALPRISGTAPPLVLCAMGTSRGLESLQGLLREWDSGRWGPRECVLGVAVAAPMPRVPHVLRRARMQVGSAAPRMWALPWIGGLEVDGFPDHFPRAYARMEREVRALVPSAVSAGAPVAGRDDGPETMK